MGDNKAEAAPPKIIVQPGHFERRGGMSTCVSHTNPSDLADLQNPEV